MGLERPVVGNEASGVLRVGVERKVEETETAVGEVGKRPVLELTVLVRVPAAELAEHDGPAGELLG